MIHRKTRLKKIKRLKRQKKIRVLKKELEKKIRVGIMDFAEE